MSTLDQLVRDLHSVPDSTDLGRPDLDTIRRAGRGRRRRHRAAVLGGSIAVGAVLGLTFVVSRQLPSDDPQQSQIASAPQEPRELSDLARRVLREVPGAEKVSPWQVVIPAGGAAPRDDRPVDSAEIASEPVALPARAYTGVTAYPRNAFAPWLYQATVTYEREVLGEPDAGYPVGSTDTGVLVDGGTLELACLEAGPGRLTNGEDLPGGDCYPALLARAGDAAYLQWSMGTERFLEPGAPMELFTSDDYSTGEPATLWIGGVGGADVARVDFVTTDGRTVAGDVDAGTLVPGDSMFWARVPGELVTVVAYAADGAVIEEHQIRPCESPVDCEVR
jgi:hypothetical protein